MHKDVGKEVRCPTGFAYYGATPPGGLRRPAAAVPVFGSCCPLPSSDILLKEQVEVFEQCPEQYIATGFRLGEDCTRIPLLQYGLCGEGKGHKLLCTKVNTARYQLGEIRNGFFWGVSSKRWHESKFISKQTISAGLRFGLGRVSKYFWRESGCVGDPPGSLLVGKVSKRCRGLLFRELQYRGQSGDPKQGEAVTMFPACDEISDRFEENVFCTK